MLTNRILYVALRFQVTMETVDNIRLAWYIMDENKIEQAISRFFYYSSITVILKLGALPVNLWGKLGDYFSMGSTFFNPVLGENSVLQYFYVQSSVRDIDKRLSLIDLWRSKDTLIWSNPIY